MSHNHSKFLLILCLSLKMCWSWTLFASEVKNYVYCAIVGKVHFQLRTFFNKSITMDTQLQVWHLIFTYPVNQMEHMHMFTRMMIYIMAMGLLLRIPLNGTHMSMYCWLESPMTHHLITIINSMTRVKFYIYS